MPNYLLAYHGGGMPETEEEGKRVMAAWTSWMEAHGPAIVDGGNPVGRAVTIATSGSVSEGAGANPVSGYSIIKADNMDAAIAIAKGCPILGEGTGSIELCETFEAM